PRHRARGTSRVLPWCIMVNKGWQHWFLDHEWSAGIRCRAIPSRKSFRSADNKRAGWRRPGISRKPDDSPDRFENDHATASLADHLASLLEDVEVADGLAQATEVLRHREVLE
ncbi:MAG: hypothetical protein ACI8VE_002916, partial [Natrialbaceae archaeon]